LEFSGTESRQWRVYGRLQKLRGDLGCVWVQDAFQVSGSTCDCFR